MFSQSYQQARKSICDLAQSKAYLSESYAQEGLGRHGEDLRMDVILKGDLHAENVIVVFSGVHGVEGFCGSACQYELLENIESVDNTLFVIVHAVNPYGFSYLSRSNESNVDLNRNYIDFNAQPNNELYSQLHKNLLPTVWNDSSSLQVRNELMKKVSELGFDKVKKALYAGQYDHPNGVFYGGQELAWSVRTLKTVFEKWVANKKSAVVVDIHSGLGDYGVGNLIFCQSPDETSYPRAHAWFGEQLHSWEDEKKHFAAFDGKLMTGLSNVFPETSFTNLTLEYGTLIQEEMIETVIADNWLRNHKVSEKTTGAIHEKIKLAFAPDDSEWQERVIKRFSDVMGQITFSLNNN